MDGYETNLNTPVSLADLPRYNDLLTQFQSVQKDPDAQPLSLLQKLKLFVKNMGEQLIDRLNGIETPSEYNTGRVYIPTFHGEEYSTTHVKDGQVLSETLTHITARRYNQGIQKNEIKSTRPLTPNGLSKVLSRHSYMTTDGEKDQILTEGVTLSNGVSYVRTQNFETGETIFRKNDKGLFWMWTFDRNKRLISNYEGQFGEIGKPNIISQTDYKYNAKGQLISALETRNTITSEDEKILTINHPIISKKQKTLPNIGGRG
ncbi:MAG: hypothetical protein IKS41_02475 [Alphaproteobacteria bacterium]|nr:hypothetical protein [Alphaproteobacteria bacterium]